MANALIQVSVSAKLSSTSFFVSFTASSTGSSSAMFGVSTYISCGMSIYISTFLMLYVLNFILLISIFEAEELSCSALLFSSVLSVFSEGSLLEDSSESSLLFSVFSSAAESCSSFPSLFCSDTADVVCSSSDCSSGTAKAVVETDMTIKAAASITASLFIKQTSNIYLKLN